MSRTTVQEFLGRLGHAARVSADAFSQCREVIIHLENARLAAETTIHHELEGRRTFRDGWTDWTTPDAGVALFQAALHAGTFIFAPMTKILEVGCCESEWMTLALHADPTLQVIGVDWRATPDIGVRLKADVRVPILFPPETLDWVVSLSAIEHIGLGHYDADPIDPSGDSVAMQNIRTWLKPGGQVYFDVPYRPEGYRVEGTAYRLYDDRAIHDRLLQGFDVHWMGYTLSSPIELVPKPDHTVEGVPFHYVAIHAGKAATTPQ